MKVSTLPAFVIGTALLTVLTVSKTSAVRAEVVPIEIGASITNRLEPGDDQLDEDGSYFDTYTFAGSAGQQIVITMSSEELDSYLILLDTSGNSLIQDDDGGGDLDARILYTLPADGQYTIYANAYSGGVGGAYRLELQSVVARSPVRVIPSDRRYFCDEMVNPPVTRARRKDGVSGTLLEWTDDLAVANLSTLQRCRQVADNLETIHNRLGRNFAITAGRIRNQPVVCAATAPGVCDPNGQILTATSDANARDLAIQIGTSITELRSIPIGSPEPASTPVAANLRPDDGTPLSVTPVFTFRDALAYSYCLEDVIQLYQDPNRLQREGRRGDCLEEVFARYGNGISRSQALALITEANQYATESLRPSVLYPPRGQRVRIQELFDFTYPVDQP